MINLTFLQAKVGRLAKTVSAQGVAPYPNAKQFISHHEMVKTLPDFAAKLRAHAASGHCLHVGDLTRPIPNWDSRAGLADRSTPLQWLVLDIDGIATDRHTSVFIADHMEIIARETLEKLDVHVLSNTSCVVQASSKMGLDPRKVSMHVFYLLDSAVPATQLKLWLKHLNLSSEFLQRNISLNATGHALKWPLDITSVDPGRLIYIAPPIFEHTMNPFSNDDDRIFVLKAEDEWLSSSDIMQTPATNIREARTKNALRELAGLPNEKARLRQMVIQGERHELLLNPAPGVMRPHARARGFCYYNLNEGDSGAYYHPEGRPEVIFNFKGEPAFRFEDVDPEGYARYCEENQDAIIKANPTNAFIVINKQDDQLYKVWHNREDQTVALVRTRRDQVEDFYMEYGQVEPPFIPTWQIDHWPTQDFLIDYTGKSINLFIPTDYMRAGQRQPYEQAPTAEDPTPIRAACPNIWFLLNHIVGNGQEELYHLLNWLAIIFKTRRKTESAIILQGTEGVGKGTLFEEIIAPLMGPDNVTLKTNAALSDKFNGWRRGKLVVCFDEFEVPNNAAGRLQLAELREWITGHVSPIREMRQTSQNFEMYDSYIFFTNQFNMLPIPEKDRRYTVCPRQDIKLELICDTTKLRASIKEELAEFASLLHAFEIDVERGRRCLNNEAKEQARQSSATMAEEFVIALRTGNLDFMLQVFEAIDPSMVPSILDLDGARRTVIEMIRSRKEPTHFQASALTQLYNVMLDQRMHVAAFSKMLSRHGFVPERYYNHARELKRGFKLKMHKTMLTDDKINEYLATNKAHLTVVNE